MTEMAFHFNVEHKVDYACRFLRKAMRRGTGVVVTAESSVLTVLDAALWTFSRVDFVPHSHAQADIPCHRATPVVLTSHPVRASSREALLNLGHAIPDGFEQFERVIELVGQDDNERRLARGRWKHYAQRGYRVEGHDIATRVVG